jgi:nicotinamidase/pyrazinamidase
MKNYARLSMMVAIVAMTIGVDQVVAKPKATKAKSSQPKAVTWKPVNLKGQRKFSLYMIDVQPDFMEGAFIENDANRTRFPKGRLAVAGTGEAYVQGIYKFYKAAWAVSKTDLKYVNILDVKTQDWHPKNSVSLASTYRHKVTGEMPPLFAPLGDAADQYAAIGGEQCPAGTVQPIANQVLWPDHCIQGTVGAQIPDMLFKGGSYAAIKGQALRTGLQGNSKTGDYIVEKGTSCGIDSYSGFLDNDGSTKTESEYVLHRHHITDLLVCGIATDYCVRASVLHAVAAGFMVHLIANLCRGVAVESMIAGLKDMSKAHGPNGAEVKMYVINDLKDGGNVVSLLEQAKVPYEKYETTQQFLDKVVLPYQPKRVKTDKEEKAWAAKVEKPTAQSHAMPKDAKKGGRSAVKAY